MRNEILVSSFFNIQICFFDSLISFMVLEKIERLAANSIFLFFAVVERAASSAAATLEEDPRKVESSDVAIAALPSVE